MRCQNKFLLKPRIFVKQDEGRQDAVFNFRLGVFQHDMKEKNKHFL
jgi:hypothetical protein